MADYQCGNVIWAQWCGDQTGGVVTYCTPATGDYWGYWNQGYAASGSQTVTVKYEMGQWVEWNQMYVNSIQGQAVAHPVTPADVQAQRARQDAYQQQIRENEEKKRIAEEKAEALLMLYLTDEQKKSYKEHGHFETQVNDRRYRLRKGSHGNVRELDKTGKEVASLCVNVQGVPYSDNVLAQFLALHTDEDYLRRTANHTRLC